MDILFAGEEAKRYGLTIFISIVFFQVAYILLQWRYNRRIEYLYYVAYMLLIVVYALGEFEHVLPFKLFTRFISDYSAYAKHAMPLIALVFYYRFARAFLNLPETRPYLNKQVKRLEYFMFSYALLSPVFLLSGRSREIEEILFLAVCGVTVSASAVFIFSFLNKSIPLTRFAMMGAGLLLSGSIITLVLLVLESAGHHFPFDPYLPLLLCVIAELLTFTTGLSLKAQLIEKEKRLAEHALVQELTERQKLEDNMHQLRNKIAGDLHDDVGATLSGIGIYTEVAKNKLRDNKLKETTELLDRIFAHTSEMQISLREMLWVINPGNDSLEALWDKIGNYCKPLLSARNITFDFTLEPALRTKKLSLLQRRNIYLVCKEGVNNILKHARCNNVEIFFSSGKNNFLFVTIRDNGTDFDATDELSGNGIPSMKNRAEELNGQCEIISDTQKGTSILLAIPFE